MKVLHINAGLENGGGFTHIVNLLMQAKKEKQNFDLLTLQEGPVAQAARQKGITTYCLEANGRYDLKIIKRLRLFITEHGYNIVHTHGARANLLMSLIHKKIPAIWCVTVHSDPYLDFVGRGLIGKAFTKLNLHALAKADCVFAITQRFAKLLKKRVNISPDKIYVIYNGISFHDNNEIPAKYEHTYFNIINVARAEKVKGQRVLLKALKQINDAHVRLHIAGDGSELENLKALARQLGVAPQVTFHGMLDQQQLKILYRGMDLAVLTSYSESFPLVLLEASDNQVPILSTDIGDIQMMIPSQDYGFIAQTGNITSVAQTLKQAINKPSIELEQMALREKKYLANHFSLKQQLAAIEKVYYHIEKNN